MKMDIKTLLLCLRLLFGVVVGPTKVLPAPRHMLRVAEVFCFGNEEFIRPRFQPEGLGATTTFDMPVNSIATTIGLSDKARFTQLSLTSAMSPVQLGHLYNMPAENFYVEDEETGKLKASEWAMKHGLIEWGNRDKRIDTPTTKRAFTIGGLPFSHVDGVPAAFSVAERFMEHPIFKNRYSDSMMVPMHPKWVFGDQKKSINFLVDEGWASSKHPLALKIKTNREDFLKAGKYIHGDFISNTIVGKMYICPKPAPCGRNKKVGWDGNMAFIEGVFVDFDKKIGLVKGLVSTTDDPKANGDSLLKGRGMVSNLIARMAPDGTILPADCIGWTTCDNIKYGEYAAGTFVNVFVGFTKDEDHVDRDGYALNIISAVLGRWPDKVKDLLNSEIEKNCNRVAKRMANPFANLEETVADILIDGKDLGSILAADALKASVGIHNATMRRNLEKVILRRMRSLKSKISAYVPIVYADTYMGIKIPEGKILFNEKMNELAVAKNGNLPNKPFLAQRNPVTSYQSYLTVTRLDAVAVDGLDVPMVIMNPSDAAYQQGDGDDHITLFFSLWSNFTGGEDPIVARDLPKDTAKLTMAYACIKSAIVQSLTGLVFNAGFRSNAADADRGASEAELKETQATFGVWLDACVQAIKKLIGAINVGSVRNEERAHMDLLEDFQKTNPSAKLRMSDLAVIVTSDHSDDVKDAVNDLFGIRIPSINLPVLGNPELPAANKVFADAWLKKVANFATEEVDVGRFVKGVATRWHSALLNKMFTSVGIADTYNVGGIKRALTIDVERLDVIVDTYALIATECMRRSDAARKAKNSKLAEAYDAAIQVMNGELIYVAIKGMDAIPVVQNAYSSIVDKMFECAVAATTRQ